MGPDAGQVADPVAVGVGEGPGVDLVEDGLLATRAAPVGPSGLGAVPPAGWSPTDPGSPSATAHASARFLTRARVASMLARFRRRRPGTPDQRAGQPQQGASVVLEPLGDHARPLLGARLHPVGPPGHRQGSEGHVPGDLRSGLVADDRAAGAPATPTGAVPAAEPGPEGRTGRRPHPLHVHALGGEGPHGRSDRPPPPTPGRGALQRSGRRRRGTWMRTLPMPRPGRPTGPYGGTADRYSSRSTCRRSPKSVSAIKKGLGRHGG